MEWGWSWGVPGALAGVVVRGAARWLRGLVSLSLALPLFTHTPFGGERQKALIFLVCLVFFLINRKHIKESPQGPWAEARARTTRLSCSLLTGDQAEGGGEGHRGSGALHVLRRGR